MPLPAGFVGLVVADTRRAIAWERALAAEGLEVARVETSGSDVEKGDWQVGVARWHESRGRAFVSAVLSGERTLPRTASLAASGVTALWAIAAVIALLAVAGVVAWLGA